VTQIFPPTPRHARQINSAIAWYIWKSDIFRVLLSTLQREKNDGGWDLITVDAKCRALFLHRLQMQCRRAGSLTADCMLYGNLDSRLGNQPNPFEKSEKQEYLRIFIKDYSYIPGQGGTELTRAYNRRIYATLRDLSIAESPPQKMRVESIWPNADWRRIWENLTQMPTSEPDKAEWDKVIHYIIPTNKSLQRIKISLTALCGESNNRDKLVHRLTECRERQSNWVWLRSITARMLRTSSTQITQEWIVRPQFSLWPPQRHRATLCLLARYVTFSMKRRHSQNPNDLMDFLIRSR